MIHRVGEEFLIVDPNSLDVGESARKLFVGMVTLDDKTGSVTHLWLRGAGDSVAVGYPTEDIKPVQ